MSSVGLDTQDDVKGARELRLPAPCFPCPLPVGGVADNVADGIGDNVADKWLKLADAQADNQALGG